MAYRSFARIAALLVVLLVIQLVLSPFTLYRDFGLLPACASSRDRDCTEEEAAVEAAQRVYDKAAEEVENRTEALKRAENTLKTAEARLATRERNYQVTNAVATFLEALAKLKKLPASVMPAVPTATDRLPLPVAIAAAVAAVIVMFKKIVVVIVLAVTKKRVVAMAAKLAPFVRAIADATEITRNIARDTRNAAKIARDEARIALGDEYSGVVRAYNEAKDTLYDAEALLARCQEFK